MSPFTYLILAFVAAAGLVVFSMPALIRVAELKRLVDEPKEGRKMHSKPTPTIGGVAVFLGLMTSCTMWMPHAFLELDSVHNWGAFFAAMMVLFFMGVKDDLVGLSPSKKLLVHLLLGGLLLFEGSFRIKTFDGLFGVEEIPFYVSAAFSLFVYIVVVNAINLIDGVDGLAGGYGVLAATAFGISFFASGNMPEAIVAIALAGSLAGFLKFNWTPARIFLGDGGSLITGMTFYVLCVQWINLPLADRPALLTNIPGPVLSMSFLAYPLVDTLRVFTLRLLKGRSPFSPDRNHLHHRMMALRWGHRRTSTTVYLYTGIMLTLPYLLFNFVPLPKSVLFVMELGIAFALFWPILRKSLAARAKKMEQTEQTRRAQHQAIAANAAMQGSK